MTTINKVVTYRIHIHNNQVTTIKQIHNQRESKVFIRRVAGYENTYYIASKVKHNRIFSIPVITCYINHVLRLMGSNAQVTNQTNFIIKK